VSAASAGENDGNDKYRTLKGPAMGFQVTGPYLAECAAACDSTASDVSAQLDSLRTYVTGVEGWWQGIAANSFQALMADYHQRSVNLNDALTAMANIIRTNWANYAGGEQDNVANITGITAGLPPPNLG
jgi:WXG100 family type VII secretion target